MKRYYFEDKIELFATGTLYVQEARQAWIIVQRCNIVSNPQKLVLKLKPWKDGFLESWKYNFGTMGSKWHYLNTIALKAGTLRKGLFSLCW